MGVEKKDLIINGFGSSSGGSFDDVSVNGKGTVVGDIKCNKYDCNGLGNVNGNVTADRVQINGKGKINGNLVGRDITVDGHSTLGGDVTYESFRISGSCSIGGMVKGERLKINGKATIGGDCETEEFVSEGIFKIGGLLNAEDIDITLYGECMAKEIGGQSIRVRQKSYGLIKIFKTLFPSRLVATVIEGDDIYLEGVRAKIVRGNNVVIGKDCEIDLVEYFEDFTNTKGSKVKEHTKL
ncbi:MULTISPECIES: polymer-forming cytoskeletal protein [Heyndrickxia]|jgi:cytoskeletal protein CcmA (bactofilin family)|uniref:polymer-forming cytoskeletal protein n=1 Tax=Heyndrickxia TaxID=2837504 RepID=UPI0003A433AD|nr:polymer-forming cytoskeletal protein [Heyndrickxia oleronia]MCI1589279.1 polymer-forming cytoskeletal protein [Heyndrickxia oleronia]MCI1612430.1 polymer-forming cytoskeletal protein [Heyndrickxia oleronia]MCI1743608.1 polymer-forming cytoskeletal protein [Heyndrickxia oleronia]MCI1760315.1 polymer-forming cytoskeletal protein [Heyndrickxia oleronia]